MSIELENRGVAQKSPVIERLECRRLLTAQVVDNVLVISGTQDPDIVDVSADNSDTTVRLNSDTLTFANSDFDSIEITGGEGADRISLENISTSALLDGGEGNDTIIAGLGDDTIEGGSGNDTLDYSGRTTQLLKNDALERVIRTDAGEADTYSDIETLLCGSGDDEVTIFHYTDSLRLIDGGAGNDSLAMGGPEATEEIDPTIHGGAGNDTIDLDRDRQEGSGGVAFYYGDAGDDTLVMRRQRTNRQFFGGDGIDSVDYRIFTTAGGLHVTLDDQDGDGPFSDDNVHSDVEVVYGSMWNDTLIGGDNNETLIGGNGNDSLVGNGGDDSLDGGDGADTMTGGSGADRYSSEDGDVVNSDSQDPSPPSTPGPFVVVGTARNDQIIVRMHAPGSSQLDVIVNGKTISHNLADITSLRIDGGRGNDRILFNESFGKITIATVIDGGAGNDVIVGSSAADEISGGAGNDVINAGAGDDKVYGNAGNDILFGDGGADLLDGGAGRDFLRGGGGKDRIMAFLKRDDFRGNKGDLIFRTNLA